MPRFHSPFLSRRDRADVWGGSGGVARAQTSLNCAGEADRSAGLLYATDRLVGDRGELDRADVLWNIDLVHALPGRIDAEGPGGNFLIIGRDEPRAPTRRPGGGAVRSNT